MAVDGLTAFLFRLLCLVWSVAEKANHSLLYRFVYCAKGGVQLADVEASPLSGVMSCVVLGPERAVQMKEAPMPFTFRFNRS